MHREPLTALDRCAFRQLLEIQETFDHGALRIWSPQFRPDRLPMVLVRRSTETERAAGRYELTSFAVNLPAVADCAPTVELELPIALRSTVQLFDASAILSLDDVLESGHPEADDEGRVRLDLEIAGQDCVVLLIDSPSLCVRTSEFARFIVHEAFHLHQLFVEGWRVPMGYDPNVPFRIDPTDVELAGEETRFIEAAATAPSLADGLFLAERFLEVRARRHARRPDLARLEPGNEQIEGSARFVENQYSFVNGRERRLSQPSERETLSIDHLQFGRHYRTGARACELLERLEIPWRQRLREGADPVGLLSEALMGARTPELAVV